MKKNILLIVISAVTIFLCSNPDVIAPILVLALHLAILCIILLPIYYLIKYIKKQ